MPITLEADRMGNFEPKEFDKEKHLGDPHYRDQLGGHYGSGH